MTNSDFGNCSTEVRRLAVAMAIWEKYGTHHITEDPNEGYELSVLLLQDGGRTFTTGKSVDSILHSARELDLPELKLLEE